MWARFEGPETPGQTEQTRHARRHMPQPPAISLPNHPNERMVNRSNQCAAIHRSQPRWDRRPFFRPVHGYILLHSEKMYNGPASLFQEAPQGLHVVMMHPTIANTQPLALAGFHQVERDV